MTFRLKRIKISMKLSMKYLITTYWRTDFETIMKGIIGLCVLILKLIGFLPFVICDILSTIFISPFDSGWDKFEEVKKE